MMRSETTMPTRAMLLAAALALLSGHAPARALDCETAQTQTDLSFCAGRAYSEADQRLNDLYRTLKERLAGDHDTLARLVTAQRAWIGFRDAECDFSISGTEGGSVQSMVKAACLKGETERRIERLTTYAACAEGDVACPVPPAPPAAN